MRVKNVLLFICMLLDAAIFSLVASEDFYVRPSTTVSCPNQEPLFFPGATQIECHTLSEYAANPIRYFPKNVDVNLIFLPGNHTLSQSLFIQGYTQLTISIESSSDSRSTTVICDESASLSFESISSLTLNGIRFVGCVGNAIAQVEHLMIDNCLLDGRKRNGTGLNLNFVQNAIITGVNFTANTGSHISDLFNVSRVFDAGGAIIANTSTVFLSSCTFQGNIAYFAGAIYSAYSVVSMDECSFVSNEAQDLGGSMYTGYTSLTITNSNFTNNSVSGKGNGGALELLLNSSVSISNTVFLNNTAQYGGGAIDAFDTYRIEMTNVQFLQNRAKLGSAIYVELTVLLSSSIYLESNAAETSVIHLGRSSVRVEGNSTIFKNIGSVFVFASNVTFIGDTYFLHNIRPNSANFFQGGAITSFRSQIIFVKRTYFMYNSAKVGGAIAAIESTMFMYGEIQVMHNTGSSGGGIFLYRSTLLFNRTAEVFNNTAWTFGGGIHSISSTTSVEAGSVKITKNHAKSGGGMYLELNAKLYVAKIQAECDDNNILCTSKNSKNWIRLEFVENTAEENGGAIYVADNTNPATCGSKPFTKHSSASECFFQNIALHSVTAFVPTDLNLRNTYYFNNSANISGNSIYGGLLDRCAVNPFSELFRTQQFGYLHPKDIDAITYLITTTNIDENDIQQHIHSDPVRLCFCSDNNKPNCSYNPPTLKKVKGQMFEISLVAVDQLNNTVSNSTVISYLDNLVPLGFEGQSTQNTNANGTCSNLEFNVFAPEKSVTLFLFVNDGPCEDIGISLASIDIEFLRCPPGFKTVNSKCECNPVLYPNFVESCSVDTSLVTRSINPGWFSIVNITENDQEEAVYVTFTNCPFDYCRDPSEEVSIDLSIKNGSDALCAFNRTGVLCGACDQSSGLSHTFGGSRCLPCSNHWLTLLILFMLAGIVLVGFLLIFNLTVAIGSIDALIFYTNIVGANRATFLPFDESNLLSVFISWFNLDFGFQTCFYDGMNEYAKVWLQLVFPVYIIFLVAMVIVISKYNSKFANLLSKRNPIAILATLILLSFTKLVRTVIAALSFAALTVHVNGSNETEVVWLIDGNVPYFVGKHIPLVLVAIIVFFITLAYTLLLFFWQWLQGCPNKKFLRWIHDVRLSSFMDAHNAPFNKHYRYWTGLLLIVRAILYLLSAFNVFGDPKIPLLSILILVGSIHLLRELVDGKIYKQKILNKLDAIFLYNLLIFTAATLYIVEANGGNQVALAYASTTVAFVLFLIIMLYHSYAYILKSLKPFQKLNFPFASQKKNTLNFIVQFVADTGDESQKGQKPLLEGSGDMQETIQSADYSKFRGSLELLDSESFSVQNHRYKPPATSSITTSAKERRVTYSVVEAIPSLSSVEEEEQNLTEV